MVRRVPLQLSHIRRLPLLLHLPPYARQADMCRGLAPRPCFECYPVGLYIQILVFTPSSSWLPALKVLWSLNHPSHLFFSAVVDLGGAAAMIPDIPRPASPRPC